MNAQAVRESVTDAMKFWEPLRLVYNGVLAVIVIGYFLAAYPESRSVLTIDLIFVGFLLAVLANVAYCGAYVADLFAQASGFREVWRRFRWALFAIGLAFAGSRCESYHQRSGFRSLTLRIFALDDDDRIHGIGRLLQSSLAFRTMRKFAIKRKAHGQRTLDRGYPLIQEDEFPRGVEKAGPRTGRSCQRYSRSQQASARMAS